MASILSTDTSVAREHAGCAHCGLPVADEGEEFCCAGCRVVFGLLHSEGLDRYYDLRRGTGIPVPDADGTVAHDNKWLEGHEARLADAEGACRVSMDVQGIHCAACVWLVQELFERKDGGGSIVVNPALGRADLTIGRDFPLRTFVDEVERFGYRLGPALKRADRGTDELLLRTGIALALAGNTMLFAVAIYLGLADGPLFTFVHQVSYALAVVSVLVGGSVFFRGAYQGLRRGVLHLDVPIAVGILLAFAGSTWSFFFDGARAVYFDSVTVFIALMLLGRFLQERTLSSHRRRLLESDGIENLLTRRVKDGRVELLACRDLTRGDVLLIAPGDLVPVDCALASPAASISLDWIDGESRPRGAAEGELVPAGAFNAGDQAFQATAASGFADSALIPLLRSTRDDGEKSEGFGRGRFWQRVSTVYVVAVLFAAVGGFVYWATVEGDPRRALEVSIAVLVVTCPCAFGIATPLAYELVLSGLRRAGLFIRRAGFLDRARHVHKVVFDKTGTLTTGGLELADPAALQRLGDADRRALYDLSARSAHPKSQALAKALEGEAHHLSADVAVRERAGLGLEAVIDGAVHRLGSPAFTVQETRADLVYTVDGVLRAAFETREVLRPDARREARRLRERGYELFILSGDSQARVTRMAAELEIDPERALGAQRPEQKGAWLEAHDTGDTLMLGDGINDAMAVDRAFCSGTPAVDRPFMPARTDFYLVTPGLRPLALALRGSEALAQVVRRNLAFAIAYNLLAVGLAWAGLMKPWLAAVLMPLSSLLILAATSWALSSRSKLWKS